jgi:hypothetical protein
VLAVFRVLFRTESFVYTVKPLPGLARLPAVTAADPVPAAVPVPAVGGGDLHCACSHLITNLLRSE